MPAVVAAGTQQTVMRRTIERQFHAEMLAVYDRCAAIGFRPVLLRRLVILDGGVLAAKALILQPGTTGLERLIERQQTDTSMEALMVSPQYQALFTPTEIHEARKRLAGSPRERARGRLQAPTSP